jgi:prevent-host-death family protein
MITTIPMMATVADLQRGYRALVNKIKKTGEPLVVVNNGQPDVVIMDTKVYNERVERMRELEEDYLLKVGEEAMAEYKAGKSVRMKKGETLMDVLQRFNDD